MSEYLKVLQAYLNGKILACGELYRAVKWAIAELEKRDQARRVDNGDGTETWHGLPVVVPVGLIPDGELPVEVRSRALIPEYESDAKLHVVALSAIGKVEKICGSARHPGDLRITFAAKPDPIIWTPPASLPDGEYQWSGTNLVSCCKGWVLSKRGSLLEIVGADWTDPPNPGRYRKVGSTATWIGE